MTATTDAAIFASDISKRYGPRAALDGVSVEVPPGSVLGLLGHNGAGKTTLVRVLTTLVRPDAGSASVAGHDVLTAPAQVRRSIGLVGQHAAIDEYLTGRENLLLVTCLLRLRRAEARSRVGEALETFGLEDLADQPAATYSGGFRRRLDIAVTLLARPAVVFLDEPTTGLDPASRQELWQLVERLVAGGTTILLTTQYLEEADRLADTVAIMDRGRMVATGTPDDLKARLGGDTVQIRMADPARLAEAGAVLQRTLSVEATQQDESTLEIRLPDASGALPEALRHLDGGGLLVTAAEVRRPGLDDVFLAVTGRHATGDDPHEPTAARHGHRHSNRHHHARSHT